MTKLLFASLLALSATAIAEPTPPTPPGPPSNVAGPACDKSGGVLIEERQQLEVRDGASGAVYTITVYAGGAWERADRKPSSTTSSGCMAASQIATIKTALASKWIVKHAETTCAAIGSTFVTFASQGKQLWAEHVCQADYLDEKSGAALETIRTLLEKVTTPHAPPCCKK